MGGREEGAGDGAMRNIFLRRGARVRGGIREQGGGRGGRGGGEGSPSEHDFGSALSIHGSSLRFPSDPSRMRIGVCPGRRAYRCPISPCTDRMIDCIDDFSRSRRLTLIWLHVKLRRYVNGRDQVVTSRDGAKVGFAFYVVELDCDVACVVMWPVLCCDLCCVVACIADWLVFHNL